MSPAALEVLHEASITSKYLGGTKPTIELLGTGKRDFCGNGMRKSEFLLDRDLHKKYPAIVGGQGNDLYTSDGRTIFDATSGAAVSCLGYGNKRVTKAMVDQMATGINYVCSSFFTHGLVEQLGEELISGTDRKMARVYLTGSGSEAMEATAKLARQYFYERDPNTSRVNFIARHGSYHGNTLGALSISGHVARKAPYLPLLSNNVHHVSACYAYRQQGEGESDVCFVARKAQELEQKFQELGPETVIGFIAEPIVGAALGCVTAVPGYLKAMRKVCHKYGALFILDEVMSGMGRSGTLHAWQYDDAVPDLQTIGKGLGAGYQPIAAVLISEKVVKALRDGNGQFIHGQTYQGMPIQAAAALEVQRINRELDLMSNVRKQGAYLFSLLNSFLSTHPHVGDIRGRGLFWGLEFVKDRKTKEPFHPSAKIAQRVHDMAISEPWNMTLYPGTGSVDGVRGDHIIIAPTYVVTKEEIERIARTVKAVVELVFSNIDRY